MSDIHQFESEVRQHLHRHNCSAVATLNFFDDGMWRGKIVVSGEKFALTIEEFGYPTTPPFGQNELAGHSPFSVAEWYGMFDGSAKAVLASQGVADFRRMSMEPTVPCDEHHTLSFGATYIRGREGLVVKSVWAELATSPQHLMDDAIKLVREFMPDCDWFAPVDLYMPIGGWKAIKGEIAPTLASLSPVGVIRAAVATAKKNEHWSKLAH